jgi:TonB family protein
MRLPRLFSSLKVKHEPAPLRVGFATALLAVWAAAALPARAQSKATQVAPVSLDAQVAERLLKEKDAPVYPPLAKINYIQGSVRVRVVVSPKGRVTEAHVLQGHPFLAASALQAVQGWIYRPYRIGRKAIEFSTVVEFRFNLRAKPLSPFPPTAEKDLRDRVTPPTVVQPLADSGSKNYVRMRVLVDSHGHALDAEILSGNSAEIREAQEEITHWKFRPAHWGALAVPWYLVVKVPVTHWPA